MSRGGLGALTALTAAFLLLFPATAAAHAELDVPTPADGAVGGTPSEISGTFTQPIDPDGSSLVLRNTNDEVVARGGPDPDDDHRMVISDLPFLSSADYEVQWTTISAEDGELARGTWSFTVSPPRKTPGTPAPSATAPEATPELTVAPSPTDTPAPPDPTSTAGDDVVLPIIVALALVLLAAGFLLSRRGRHSDGV